MLHKTKAIILRSVPYGDTSLIVSAYTRLFGLQSYMVKGARTVSKKGSGQVAFFQPAALLDLVVYHTDLKHLQTIKEIKWTCMYQQVLSQVTKNAVALFMVEMLTKCIRQPETNPELFDFAENSLLLLDAADPAVAANLPLHFSLQLADYLGFKIEENYDDHHPILDLQEGRFVADLPAHPQILTGSLAQKAFEILQTHNPITLYRIKLTKESRHTLLQAIEQFFQFHLSDFGYLKTVKVLQAVLG